LTHSCTVYTKVSIVIITFWGYSGALQHTSMEERSKNEELSRLFERTPVIPLEEGDRYVIFSDLHMGGGGRNDDFLRNSDLFISLLRDHYLPQGYRLILNGDIEELQRCTIEQVERRWATVYDLFARFRDRTRLIKLFGNHDFDFSLWPDLVGGFTTQESVRLSHSDGDIFILHGHQTAGILERPSAFVQFSLRYFANPLGIRNPSTSHDSRKKYQTEKRIYDFARSRKIISIIGHTHRPLFESFSKVDALKYTIETLVREYISSESARRSDIEASIQQHKDELDAVTRRDIRRSHKDTLYASNLVIPCLFNSGCVVGKRGITGIELTAKEISLVHWFNKRISSKYLIYHGNQANQLPGSDFFKAVFNTDFLDYIFTRIKLLA
ncbi:MAG TPA: metallophosphoesterase, partial [Spirochaetia bacterium]|nr:metallophosphoesterase [Spirochaetia bacterium]